MFLKLSQSASTMKGSATCGGGHLEFMTRCETLFDSAAMFVDKLGATFFDVMVMLSPESVGDI